MELLPPDGVYWEPFCGSCKVVARIKSRQRYATDLDNHIITLLTSIQAGWRPPAPINQKIYDHWNAERKRRVEDPMIAFVGYGCSFAGKFFGGFARAEGNIAAKARSTLLKQKAFLKGVHLSVRDYRDGPPSKKWPAVIYCDPPYVGTTTVGSKRGRFDHAEFWEWCKIMSRAGSVVLVSEYECPVPGAVLLWSKTLEKKLKSKDGIKTKTERLFCLDPNVGKRIGFGFG